MLFNHDTFNYYTLAQFTDVTSRRFLQHNVTHICEKGINVIVPFLIKILFTLLFSLREKLRVTYTRQINKYIDLKSVTPIKGGVT
jgi:hypothetical protein